MGIQSKSGKTLSALLFAAGAAQAVHADPAAKIQAMKLLEEKRISYEEFRTLAGPVDSGKTLSTTVTSGNYSDTVTSGNYADTITAANYADTVTAGNYANTITSSNYGFAPINVNDAVPQPEEAK